ncbi:Iron-sulfur cluster regulator IscR [Labilithrix luteola]|uniref:Iron-sulfur cluster regulator IscR n=1 Tax=Labilithrix luteola TaxID=1391654 RepID=A0A0K1Q9J9_9BACT|nr:Rrf2 family transcriptional regulator [Labilithrix luteola]AKV02408.1 Iron-sulfur cluster regulator IscR [Labilithrix luteola]
MLRLSNRGRYAVRALFDLAFHQQGTRSAVQVRDVAERQRIPLRFLEQIFQDLKRAGLVESKRGPRGGFTLVRPPEEIRLGDVLRAVEGPVAMVEPKRRGASRASSDENVTRAARLREVADAVLADVGRSVERCFDEVTLRDLCMRGEEAGVRRPSATRPNAAAPPARWVI